MAGKKKDKTITDPSFKEDIDTEFYTLQETADLLKVFHTTVRRMIKSGDLPAFKVGRVWRIRRADLLQYTKERKN